MNFKSSTKGLFGLTRNGGYGIMGPKPRISLEDKGKVLALSEEGYTQREIAARVGCTQSSVSEILMKILTWSVKDAKIPWAEKKDI